MAPLPTGAATTTATSRLAGSRRRRPRFEIETAAVTTLPFPFRGDSPRPRAEEIMEDRRPRSITTTTAMAPDAPRRRTAGPAASIRLGRRRRPSSSAASAAAAAALALAAGGSGAFQIRPTPPRPPAPTAGSTAILPLPDVAKRPPSSARSFSPRLLPRMAAAPSLELEVLNSTALNGEAADDGAPSLAESVAAAAAIAEQAAVAAENAAAALSPCAMAAEKARKTGETKTNSGATKTVTAAELATETARAAEGAKETATEEATAESAADSAPATGAAAEASSAASTSTALNAVASKVQNREAAPSPSGPPAEPSAEALGHVHHRHQQHGGLSPLFQKVADKVGKIDESRIVSSPEYLNGEVPQLYSNLRYETALRREANGTTTETVAVLRAEHSDASFLSSAALLCGTALGCGLLFLPRAVSEGSGYVPSVATSFVAWGYMTVSALLTAELLINRTGETGRVKNAGLLELYGSYLGETGGKLAGAGFLVLSYLVVGVYLSEGGDALLRLYETTTGGDMTVLPSLPPEAGDLLGNALGALGNLDDSLLARAFFALSVGTFLSVASKYNTVQRLTTHLFVPLTLAAVACAVVAGLPSADFAALTSSENQRPELALDAFPLLFAGWTYHGVVPRVVYDLEGDREQITKAIVVGSTTALVCYLAWNAVMVGNAFGGGGAGVAGAAPPAATVATELAVVTSLVGTVLGFVNEFDDAVGTLPSDSPGPKEDDKWKLALLTLLPPAIASVALGARCAPRVDNYQVIDYAGIFGSSTLFLVLPALMAWENRYGSDDPPRPLTVRPMVPLGKIPLGSLYKAAGTLIVEQGLAKLGVFEYLKAHVLDKLGGGG
ncbi:hypothetical protein ACHAWF_011222 [Thalassiosira exigua]